MYTGWFLALACGPRAVLIQILKRDSCAILLSLEVGKILLFMLPETGVGFWGYVKIFPVFWVARFLCYLFDHLKLTQIRLKSFSICYF